MYQATARKGVGQYANIHTETLMEEASPHRLIEMLMDGFLARVYAAKGAMQRSDFEQKSLYISKAIGIVGGLIEGLDLEKGGELAENLYSLYQYINNQLLQASRDNDEAILDEVVVSPYVNIPVA
ncbi:flagellar export chaperone FliS [methane-oxidizing endosymbiont of Gigantopelta aegis]|uniref:flagellar export chaperone FliS n=1 Tax=methane-oxidizing endosymbiont of Gigantopelta aegis TaxID=2794938 RepID=UPI0018DB8A4B|nr:flagellar export chaperone FliS [methane-oxidizing endosymbiont of Gigantopelta aegis]